MSIIRKYHNHNTGYTIVTRIFSITNTGYTMVTRIYSITKVSKGAKIRNRYNQVPYLTQDTNGKVTNSQLDTTNKSQEVSPFPAGDHKAHINRLAQRHSKHKTEQNHKRSTKEEPSWNNQLNILQEGLNRFHGAPTSPLIQMWIKTHRYLVCMKDP